jgi:hypothetical protein
MQERTSSDAVEAIKAVLHNLAEEIEHHYEDADVVAAGPTIARMKAVCDLLAKEGADIPPSCERLFGRHRMQHN